MSFTFLGVFISSVLAIIKALKDEVKYSLKQAMIPAAIGLSIDLLIVFIFLGLPFIAVLFTVGS